MLQNILKKNEIFYFLTIAASDTAGAAGIQQDLKMANLMGFWGLNVITAITSQNFNSAQSIDIVKEKTFISQLEIIFNSYEISAIKIGVLPTKRFATILSRYLKRVNCPVVYDPVIETSSGMKLIKDNLVNIYKIIRNRCTVVTPNIPEYLVGNEFIRSSTYSSKHCNIYLKGGHGVSDKIEEYLYTNEKTIKFEYDKHDWKFSRGTGCAFSSLLSMYLVDNDIETACRKAHEKLVNIYNRRERIYSFR